MPPAVPTITSDLLADAQAIVRAEAQSILALADRLNAALPRAIELIKTKTGPDQPGLLVITGVGKPGIVGQRL